MAVPDLGGLAVGDPDLVLAGVLQEVERRATVVLRRNPEAVPDEVVAESLRRTYRHLPLEPGTDLRALGAVHEALLARTPEWDGRALRMVEGSTRRKVQGSYFTPQRLIDHLLDETLEPALDEATDPLDVRVIDPSCGTGLFLVEAVRRIALRVVERHGLELPAAYRAVLPCVSGVELDAAAVELARRGLALLLAGEAAPGGPGLPRIVVGDALLAVDWPAAFPDVLGQRGGFDVVVGNPPFLNQLERLTTRSRGTTRLLESRSQGTLRPYTDLSAVFLQRAVEWARPGGRIGLVQPQSLLAARDAARVRRYLSDECALESLWASAEPLFDAQVLTCAPVLRRGGEQRPVRRSGGADFHRLPDRESPDLTREWAFLLAAGLGVPEVSLPRHTGVLGDIAECTADFRDQYYGLEPFVREAADCPDGAPLVTSGAIDPARCDWGKVPVRYCKRWWEAPVVDLDALEEDPGLARWARTRMVPKVLVGTQGRVVEAVADPDGRWIPSVPTITVTAPADRLWHVLAVLLAPPVAAFAATTYAGTALSMRAIKLSARQVRGLPLPGDRDAWDEAAALVERAQTGRDAKLLITTAEVMCMAYSDATHAVGDPADDPVLAWWHGRLSRSPSF